MDPLAGSETATIRGTTSRTLLPEQHQLQRNNDKSEQAQTEQQLNIVSLNVRTACKTGRLSEVAAALWELRANVAVLQEMKWKTCGTCRTGGYIFHISSCISGENNASSAGVAIAVREANALPKREDQRAEVERQRRERGEVDHEGEAREAPAAWRVEDVNVSHPRLATCWLRRGTQRTKIVGVYAPTSAAEQEERDVFLQEMQERIPAGANAKVLVLGDFNAKMDAENGEIVGINDTGKDTADVLNGADMHPLWADFRMRKQFCGKGRFTWKGESGIAEPAVIDHGFGSQAARRDVTRYRICDALCATDHRAVCIALRKGTKKERRWHDRSRRFPEALLQGKNTDSQVKSSVETLYREVREAAKPLQVPATREQSKSWISPSTWAVVDAKNRAYTAWVRGEGTLNVHGVNGNLQAYRDYRKMAKQCWREDKNKYWEDTAEQISEMLECNNTAGAYTKLRPLYKKRASAVQPSEELLQKNKDYFQNLYDEKEVPDGPGPDVRPTVQEDPNADEALTEEINVYTDGSGFEDMSSAGLGVHFPDRQEQDISFKVLGEQVVPRGELMAVVAAADATRRPPGLQVRLNVHTDSQCTIDTARRIHEYQQCEGMKHRDAWLALKPHLWRIRWIKVKAHSEVEGNDKVGNDKADELAKAGRDGDIVAPERYTALGPGPQQEDYYGVPDHVPTDDELKTAVRRMPAGKAPGPSGMRIEIFKEAAKEETGDQQRLWAALAKLIVRVWVDNEVPQAFATAVLVLLPKKPGATEPAEMRGIALLDVVYKILSRVNTTRCATIPLLAKQHGFRKGKGCHHASLALKLIVQSRRRRNKTTELTFVDIEKAYDSLHRQRTISLLREYGVGPNMANVLWRMYELDTLCIRMGDVYTDPIQPGRGVKQGDGISCIIFNVVIDAVLRKLQTIWRGFPSEPDNEDDDIFFADDGALLAESKQVQQDGLDKLAGLAEWYGARFSIKKTETMTMEPPSTTTKLSEVAYERMMTGEGMTYNERRRINVPCMNCGKPMKSGSLKGHVTSKYCREHTPLGVVRKETQKEIQEYIAERARGEVHAAQQAAVAAVGGGAGGGGGAAAAAAAAPAGDDDGDNEPEPMEYVLSMPTNNKGDEVVCPQGVCGFTADRWDTMRKHFENRHERDTLIIREQEERWTHGTTNCSKCGWRLQDLTTVIEKHQTTKRCADWAARRQKRELRRQREQEESVTIKMRGEELKRTEEFKHLGRIVTAADDDSAAVRLNVSRARGAWAALQKVMRRHGASREAKTKIYRTVCETTALFACQSWALKAADERRLRSFQRSALLQITRQFAVHDEATGEWTHTSTAELLRSAEMEDIVSIARRRRLATAMDLLNRSDLTQTARVLRKVWKEMQETSSVDGDTNHTLWITQVQSDMSRAGLTYQDANNPSKVRKQLKATQFS